MGIPGTSTLPVNGDVDLTTAANYLAEAKALLASDSLRTLVIDLAGAEFIDSQGVGFLIESRNIAVRKGVDIRLKAVPSRVRKVLQITGLEPVFTFED